MTSPNETDSTDTNQGDSPTGSAAATGRSQASEDAETTAGSAQSTGATTKTPG